MTGAASVASDAALLAALPGVAFGFVLLLARVGAAVMLLPGLGEADLPAVVRAGVAVGLCALLLPGLLPMMPPVPGDAGRLAAEVGAEVLTGLWIGWLARLIALALPFAGQLVSYMIGLASVLQQDPVLGAQATALGRLFSLAAPVLLLASGLYAVPVEALASSYDLLKPGVGIAGGIAASSVVDAVSHSFALAFRLSSPFVLTSIVWQLAMGLIGRLVPRLQIHFAALPGLLLSGMVLLAALSGAMLAAWMDGTGETFRHLPGLG